MEMEKTINQIVGVKWVRVEKVYDLNKSPAYGAPLFGLNMWPLGKQIRLITTNLKVL